MKSTCDNCGVGPGQYSCFTAWSEPHTHPRSLADMSPVPCDLWLCGRCARRIERHLRGEPLTRQGQWNAEQARKRGLA